MTREEADNMAKSMSYRQAIYNALNGRCIPYRKATKKKLFELLEILEAQSCEDDEHQESAIAVWLDLHRKEAQPCEDCETGNPCLYCKHEFAEKSEEAQPCENTVKTPEEKITYGVICAKMPTPRIFSESYDEAVRDAKFNNPNYRPYYIVERTEHFEICGVVEKE